jgi:hypothetical protein
MRVYKETVARVKKEPVLLCCSHKGDALAVLLYLHHRKKNRLRKTQLEKTSPIILQWTSIDADKSQPYGSFRRPVSIKLNTTTTIVKKKVARVKSNSGEGKETKQLHSYKD